MALPRVIPTGTTSVGGGDGGPYISGGAVYVVARGFTITDITVWKSTDPDASAFVEQDSGNAFSGASTIDSWASYQFGTDIHIVGQSVGGDVEYALFHMATDLWDGTIGTEAVTSGLSINTPENISMVVRAGPDVICQYTGNRDNVMGNKDRVDYARREGGSWTVDIAVDNGGANNYNPGTIVLGSSDRSHFFLGLGDTGGILHQRTLTSGNSFETWQTAFNIGGGSLGIFARGASYDDGGTERVRAAFSDNGNDGFMAELDSGDTPTTGTSGVASDNAVFPSSGFDSHRVVVDDAKILHYVYIFSGSVWRDENDDDAGWGTDVEEITSISAPLTGAAFFASSLSSVNSGNPVVAVLITDSGDVSYDEISLVAPTVFLQDPIHGPGIIPFLRA